MPVLQRCPGAVWTEFDSQVVILSMSSWRYFETRGVGADIWHLLERPCTVDEIARHVVKRYEVEPDRGERDVLSFLQSLRQAGLLVEVDSAAPTAS